MPSSKDDSKPRKVIDVTEPGKSEPSATSRSIIVTNRPMLQQDPMVVAGEPSDRDTDNTPSGKAPKPESQLSSFQQGQEIKPPSDPGVPPDSPKTEQTLPAETESKPTVTESTNQPPADETEEKPEAEIPVAVTVKKADMKSTETADTAVNKEPPKVAESETEPKDELPAAEPDSEKSTSETNTNDDQLAPNKVIDEAAKKAQAEKAAKEAEQQKVIDSKKYFLPINTVQLRRNKFRAVLLFLIVVALAAVLFDISLDAGFLKINGVNSLTHFFSS
jgi:hypothetical protein